jgi:hypothetical protein
LIYARTWVKLHVYNELKKDNLSRALVAHANNPSYCRGRDQENCGSKPAQANSLREFISKNLITIKGWQSSLRYSPKFKTQY